MSGAFGHCVPDVGGATLATDVGGADLATEADFDTKTSSDTVNEGAAAGAEEEEEEEHGTEGIG